MDIKKAVFTGCHNHPQAYNFNCHPCLVNAVGNLCALVQDLAIERK